MSSALKKHYCFAPPGPSTYADTSILIKGEGDLQWFHISARLILAPRPPMHFLHKTFPGTIDKISHCAKFHSSIKQCSYSLCNLMSAARECTTPTYRTQYKTRKVVDFRSYIWWWKGNSRFTAIVSILLRDWVVSCSRSPLNLFVLRYIFLGLVMKESWWYTPSYCLPFTLNLL